MTWMCQTDAAQWWRQWRESGTSAVGVATAPVVMMMMMLLQAVKRLTWQRQQAVMGVQGEEAGEGHGIVVSQTQLASLLCVQSRVHARLGLEEAVWP